MGMPDIHQITKEKSSWRRWVTGWLLGTVPLPGWAMLILAIIIGVPDWKSRYEFWLATAQSTGSRIAMFAPILGHPYFPGMLALVGITYLVIVGFPGEGVIRHKWLPFAAWATLAVCVSVMIVTAGFGWTEFYIRSEIAKGNAGIPRNTPDENNPNRPQIPLSTKSGNLQPDQMRVLLNEFPKLRQLIKRILFTLPPNNSYSYVIYTQYQDLLVRSGIDVGVTQQVPRGPEEEGMILEVKDVNSIPESAEKFREALEVANIHPTIIEIPDSLSSINTDFIVFIGPAPIKLN